jgi:hypothetical protein
MLFFSSALWGDFSYYVNGLPQMIDANIYNYFTRSRNIYPQKMASLGNTAVWAWDTSLIKL